MFEASVIFEENYNSKARIVTNQGGTSSGKTYSILQVLFSLAIQESNAVITVAGQDLPNLKVGPIRDAAGIIRDSPILKTYVDRFNKSSNEIHFTNGSIIEFKSYGNEQDAKSGKRQYLFVNEANGLSYDVFNQLQLRTTKKTFIDYNPTAEFWVHEILLQNKKLYPSVELLISDHRDNPFISQELHDDIERLWYQDEETWKVYARGVTGKIEGLVLKNWFRCDTIPEDAKFIANGLDFGFTNHPTGCLEVYMQNGELWVNELIYETNLTNTDICVALKDKGINKNKETIADSAEPKSIEEIRRQGWHIVPAMKGADSITNGVDILKRYKINVTRNSVNLIKELSRYVWKKDKTGKSLNVPIDAWNHLIDGLRYVALNRLKVNSVNKPKSRLPARTQTPYNPYKDLVSDMLK